MRVLVLGLVLVLTVAGCGRKAPLKTYPGTLFGGGTAGVTTDTTGEETDDEGPFVDYYGDETTDETSSNSTSYL